MMIVIACSFSIMINFILRLFCHFIPIITIAIVAIVALTIPGPQLHLILIIVEPLLLLTKHLKRIIILLFPAIVLLLIVVICYYLLELIFIQRALRRFVVRLRGLRELLHVD